MKAELDGFRPLDKDQEAAIMQKLRLDWNFHSNHLEGNSLSYGETKALILFGITAAGKPLKDHFEITGHDEAVKWVEEVVKEDRPLTENFIRELHKLILKESYESPTITPEGIPAKRIIQVGVYKSMPNHVLTPTGETFRFATPEETPAMMSDLINWYREKETDPETHPLLLAAEFHYKFIRIHPFDDGNGRTARILMNFILMKNGYPPVIIKTKDKDNYIAALQQSDAGMIVPFFEYIGKNLEESLDLMIRGAKGENIDEEDDVDKEITLIELQLNRIGAERLVKRTSELVQKIYEKSIPKLISKFSEESSKFKKFYHDAYLQEKSMSAIYRDAKEIVENISTRKIRLVWKRLHSFSIKYEFEKFNRKDIDNFNYTSSITFEFDIYHYSVKDSKDNELIRLNYDHEELTDNEVIEFVRAETKAHADFINQQIEKAKSQNKS